MNNIYTCVQHLTTGWFSNRLDLNKAAGHCLIDSWIATQHHGKKIHSSRHIEQYCHQGLALTAMPGQSDCIYNSTVKSQPLFCTRLHAWLQLLTLWLWNTTLVRTVATPFLLLSTRIRRPSLYHWREPDVGHLCCARSCYWWASQSDHQLSSHTDQVSHPLAANTIHKKQCTFTVLTRRVLNLHDCDNCTQ